MPRFRFWQSSNQPPEEPLPELAPSGRFNVRPRQDVLTATGSDAGINAEMLAKLRQRKETVAFDVEKAEAANRAENAWTERVRLIDDALALIASERAVVAAFRGEPGPAFPAIPVEAIHVGLEPSPEVTFTIAGERFRYVEEIDWAERGFQLARVDLSQESGDPASLIPEDWPEDIRSAAEEHLTASLFALATSLRNAALAGEYLPSPSLSDIVVPDLDAGGWKVLNGPSPASDEKARRLRDLDREAARLQAERAEELSDRDRWADRLSIARRRLSEVEAEITALLNQRTG